MKILQPLWYCPSRVMLVDDNIMLLKSLVRKVDPNFPSIMFTSPKDALNYLKANILPLDTLSRSLVKEIESSEKEHLLTENIAINLSPLHAKLDRIDRFKNIVVAVVDRAMNEMDGLDFCQKVRELKLPVKLILLTGHTEMDEAISAFNNHIIDAFIEKSSHVSNMVEKVNSHIKELTFQMFCENSEKLLGMALNRFSFLTQKTYASFLRKFLKAYKVNEYYIINASGSCLLVTPGGHQKVLVIKKTDDFKEAYEIANDDKIVNAEMLKALKTCQVFPYFGIEHSHFDFSLEQWEDAMISMEKVDGLDGYYGIVDLPEKVISFDYYVNKIWQPSHVEPI